MDQARGSCRFKTRLVSISRHPARGIYFVFGPVDAARHSLRTAKAGVVPNVINQAAGSPADETFERIPYAWNRAVIKLHKAIGKRNQQDEVQELGYAEPRAALRGCQRLLDTKPDEMVARAITVCSPNASRDGATVAVRLSQPFLIRIRKSITNLQGT
jgi:hypothetical protein